MLIHLIVKLRDGGQFSRDLSECGPDVSLNFNQTHDFGMITSRSVTFIEDGLTWMAWKYQLLSDENSITYILEDAVFIDPDRDIIKEVIGGPPLIVKIK